MMRCADAICTAYPSLNRDLLIAGVLVHDCGKLWEMCPSETSFEIPRDLRGELLGHISIGIEVVNALWRKLPLENWKDLTPPSEEVRLHLLHLIAAHHGELQFGSPVEPKTPEAIALHFIDNLDARLEMIFSSYQRLVEVAPGVFERVRGLNVSPVRSTARLRASEREPSLPLVRAGCRAGHARSRRQNGLIVDTKTMSASRITNEDNVELPPHYWPSSWIDPEFQVRAA